VSVVGRMCLIRSMKNLLPLENEQTAIGDMKNDFVRFRLDHRKNRVQQTVQAYNKNNEMLTGVYNPRESREFF
jgi:hypothetical protein